MIDTDSEKRQAHVSIHTQTRKHTYKASRSIALNIILIGETFYPLIHIKYKKNMHWNDFFSDVCFVFRQHKRISGENGKENQRRKWKTRKKQQQEPTEKNIGKFNEPYFPNFHDGEIFFSFRSIFSGSLFLFLMAVFNQKFNMCVKCQTLLASISGQRWWRSTAFQLKIECLEMENAYYQFNYVHQSPLINTIFHHTVSVRRWR